MDEEFQKMIMEKYGWAPDTCEEIINSPIYVMLDKTWKEQLEQFYKDLGTAEDYASVRYIVGKISFTKFHIQLFKKIFEVVYPVEQPVEGDDQNG